MSDLISKQAVLDAIFQKEYGHDYDENTDILCLKYVDIIKGMPSVEPEQQGRECASCKHSNNGECAFTETCHECMWESKYEKRVEPERTPEKCGDCISRIDILKKLNNLCNNICEYSKKQRKSMCDACNLSFVFDMIDNAKSVEPERKPGKWIEYPFENVCGIKLCDYRCNLCAYFVNAKTKFCPNCGAKMEVEE